MLGLSFQRRPLWHYSHAASILFAVLLFTAGFLCVLLWTNNLVVTDTSALGSETSTFAKFSPTVSTFTITYQVAIFGTAWNAILFVTLLVLERDALPLSTERLRYEVEKAACIVSVVGNAIYSVACIALMSTLARLAADTSSVPKYPVDANDRERAIAQMVAASASDRRAGQGATAAMAGFAAAAAIWACFMDVLHERRSKHRRNIKEAPLEE